MVFSSVEFVKNLAVAMADDESVLAVKERVQAKLDSSDFKVDLELRKLVEASAFDEREELMEGDEVPANHPCPILPKRGRPVGYKDKVPRKPRGYTSSWKE